MNKESAEIIDAQLLERTAQGDRDAFASLYDRYSGVLFSFVIRVLVDPKESEDVLQEVFLQIWTKAGQYRRDLGTPFNWAVTMARHKAIDRLRSVQRRSRLAEEVMIETTESASATVVMPDEAGNREKAQLIRSALQMLPAEQRQAIELAFFSGLTQIEISEQLREPLGTIKARIRRGMLKLRDTLHPVL
ncbi:MAG: sigma-70 family RNA polymerase sigma factor [Opitutaceae bacterium]|nr:sigma-70 family RNA polymerase sigma factor [Verrucomicrobiales bacterium]